MDVEAEGAPARARGRREFAPSEFAGNITCRIPVASSSKKSKKMKYSPNKPFNKGIIKFFFKIKYIRVLLL